MVKTLDFSKGEIALLGTALPNLQVLLLYSNVLAKRRMAMRLTLADCIESLIAC